MDWKPIRADQIGSHVDEGSDSCRFKDGPFKLEVDRAKLWSPPLVTSSGRTAFVGRVILFRRAQDPLVNGHQASCHIVP
jgi:hypothetical protein